MVVVTGGAGFIGSALTWRLNSWGREDILLVDHLDSSEKWKNLRGLKFLDYMERDTFLATLESGAFGDKVDTVFHMGACSSTTESDAGYLVENNYRYTVRIASWWESKGTRVRLIYASSAATYGGGEHGYRDDELMLDSLRPLNMYGFSKHMFDLYARRKGLLNSIVGLKFFNVFGPNENHKGEMRSVINKSFPQVSEKGRMTLFKSHRPDYADGNQVRDFVYVKDAVEMALFFMDHPAIGGIFNIGTGKARSWNDVAGALFSALGKQPNIEYIPMPETIRDKYQYHTQADVSKLRTAGCAHECMSLEDAVKDYVLNYLCNDKRLADQVDEDIGASKLSGE